MLDLSVNTVAPVCVIEAEGDGKAVGGSPSSGGFPVSRVLGNSRQKNLVASGDGGGVIRVWKLPGLYTQAKTTDANFLKNIKTNE